MAAPSNAFFGSNLQNVANTSTQRQLLTKAGYSVAPTGPSTSRLQDAWSDYFKTKGLGGASWNLVPQPQFNPQGNATPATKLAQAGGGRTAAGKAKTLAQQVPGMSPAQTLTTPGSPNFENVYAGVKISTDPVTNLANYAKQYANNAANTQFNPVIAALQQGINRQPADTAAAVSGISSLFAPVEANAATNAAHAQDATNQGIQTVGQVASQIGQAFGLGPGGGNSGDTNSLANAITQATAGSTSSLVATGAANQQSANNEQNIVKQGQTDATTGWQNQEQQNINDLRDQLTQAVTGKAAAKVSGIDTGLQQGSTLQNNYLSQLDQIGTGKEQAALADQAYTGNQLTQQGQGLDNTAKTIQNQGAAYQNKTAPLVLRDQLLGSAAQRAQASNTLALNQKTYNLKYATEAAKEAQQSGGWGNYLNNPKNATAFAANLRSLLVDPKTGQPIAGTTPSSAYNTVAHTMASAGFPANTKQGQQLLVQALQGAGFDLTGYVLGPQGLVLAPKGKGGSGPHQLTLAQQKAAFPHSSSVAGLIGGLIP